MNETRRKKPSLEVQPAGVKLGLLYALAPISWGVGELLWRRPGADAAMMWMSDAAGIVFACVT